MAIRNITHFDDALFRKTSRLVEKFDERLWNLLNDMHDTLEYVGGYGCAAVHVGILRRAIVINDKSGVIELVNPVITEECLKTARVLEGSIAPGAPRGYVERPVKVTVSAFDRNGEPLSITAEDFLAATFYHEIDHLDGILFTDKIVEIVTKPNDVKRKNVTPISSFLSDDITKQSDFQTLKMSISHNSNNKRY